MKKCRVLAEWGQRGKEGDEETGEELGKEEKVIDLMVKE